MTTLYNQKARAKAKAYLGKNWVLHPEYDSKKNAHHHTTEPTVLTKLKAENALSQHN